MAATKRVKPKAKQEDPPITRAQFYRDLKRAARKLPAKDQPKR